MKEIRIEAGDYFVMEDGTKRPVQINTEGRWATGARPFWLDVSKVSAVVPRIYDTKGGGAVLVIDGKVIESAADPAEVVAWVEGERSKLRPEPDLDPDFIVDIANDNGLSHLFLAGMRYQSGATLEEAFETP